MAALDFPNAPADGQRFNDFVWVDSNSVWDFDVVSATPFDVQYLVVAGGGGSGTDRGGGGGAGGYRSSVEGESSGGGASAEDPLSISPYSSYTVTIGAGGVFSTDYSVIATNGEDSVFASITSDGGGGGAGQLAGGASGGSGGGSGGLTDRPPGGAGTENQGFDGAGGYGIESGTYLRQGGGGGGAGEAGTEGTSSVRADGGDGVASSITGSAVYRAGGGGGGLQIGTSVGGLGGGGNQGQPGSVNTGGGAGGGGGAAPSYGANGGSGVVIIKYPASKSLAVGPGLESETDSSTVPGYKITTFTSGTDTVVFS